MREPVTADHATRSPARPEEWSWLHPDVVALYARVLDLGPVLTQDLLDGSDDAETTNALLARLAQLGLVRNDATGRVHPVPPRAAAEAWAAARELEAARARQAAGTLAEMYERRRRMAHGPVEVVEGVAAVVSTFDTLVASSREEICGFDRGPYLTTGHTERDDVQLDAMRRGVAYRVIYESVVLGDVENIRSLHESVAAGEQARTFPDIPMKLLIIDRRQAFVTAHRAEPGEVDALLVHPSPMLDALVETFEAFWRLAAPIRPAPDSTMGDGDAVLPPDEPSGETQHLLALLTAGLTDESIARAIGVSERTVSRRVSRSSPDTRTPSWRACPTVSSRRCDGWVSATSPTR